MGEKKGVVNGGHSGEQANENSSACSAGLAKWYNKKT